MQHAQESNGGSVVRNAHTPSGMRKSITRRQCWHSQCGKDERTAKTCGSLASMVRRFCAIAASLVCTFRQLAHGQPLQ